MSRAFTSNDDSLAGLSDIGERPVSPHRNLVTPEGLAFVDAQLSELHGLFAKAEAAGDREKIALVSRDLRYWTARRENAEISVPDPHSDIVRFGMTVTIEDEEANRRTWKIVGEDEADAAHGTISHASPMAQALFGRKAGDLVMVAGKEWEVVQLAS